MTRTFSNPDDDEFFRKNPWEWTDWQVAHEFFKHYPQMCTECGVEKSLVNRNDDPSLICFGCRETTIIGSGDLHYMMGILKEL